VWIGKCARVERETACRMLAPWARHALSMDQQWFMHPLCFTRSCSPPVPEEPKEPVDPAVRAKENWLRIYNKVLDQLQEVRGHFS